MLWDMSRSLRNNSGDYLGDGEQLARELLEAAGIKQTDKMLTVNAIRTQIDNLPDDTLLQVTVADFWLGLSKREGRNRRATPPPASPFTVAKWRTRLGTKADIRDWDAIWQLRTGITDAHREARKTRHRMDMRLFALQEALVWLVDKKTAEVIGQRARIDAMAFVSVSVERLAWQEMTLPVALSMRWAVPAERAVWLEVWRSVVRRFDDTVREDIERTRSEHLREQLRGAIKDVPEPTSRPPPRGRGPKF
jgi:hypothetical protein